MNQQAEATHQCLGCLKEVTEINDGLCRDCEIWAPCEDDAIWPEWMAWLDGAWLDRTREHRAGKYWL